MQVIQRFILILWILIVSTLVASASEERIIEQAFGTEIQQSPPQELNLDIAEKTAAFLEQNPEFPKILVEPFDPTKRTPFQNVAEVVVPVVADVTLVFPFIAKAIDAQAGQRTSLNARTLFRGYFTTLIGEFPRTGTVALAHNLFSSEDDTLASKVSLGLGAGVAAGIASTPVDLILTQQRLHKISAAEVIKDFYSRGGARAFTVGMGPMIVRQATIYSFLLGGGKIARDMAPEGSEVPFVYGVGMPLAALATAIVATPFDAVRGQMQRQRYVRGLKNPGMMEVGRKLIDEKGSNAIWAGFSGRLGQYILAFVAIGGSIDLLEQYHTYKNEEQHYHQKVKAYRQAKESGLLSAYRDSISNRKYAPLFSNLQLTDRKNN